MMIKKWLEDRAELAAKVPCMAPPWPLRLAAAATVVALGAYSPADVQALGLGRITVLSALGEPLRAEIDIPQISPEEAASLKAGIPAPAAFRAAGVEYNAALANAQITLQQRPDGRSFLRLTSDKIVSEPFVDLILETSWSSGRVVRDYTLLFDPPGVRQPAPAAPVAAQVPRTLSPSAPPASPAPAVATPRFVPAPVAPPPSRTERAAPTQSTAPSRAAPSDGKKVKVQAGDTAGKIAALHKPGEISLDQMLVALLRANPDAFIGGNINRVKAGALLDLPSAEQAGSLTPDEARKTLSVQSANFNEFRRKLADAAPVTRIAAADRQASGSLQTRVEEKKPATTSPDKLTLSKGAVKGKVPEAQIAESRQARDATERAAELSKNIKDLSRLQEKVGVPATASASGARTPALPLGATASMEKSGSTAPAATTSIAAAPAVKTTPSVVGGTTPTLSVASGAASAASAATLPAAAASTAQVTASAPAAGAASAPALPASTPVDPANVPPQPAPAASKPVPATAVKPAAPAEPSFVDGLLENPLIPIAAGGLITLLAGFGFYRTRQRKKATQVDSSFLESRLQPDSFFGSSGGQRVDTADAAPTGSSLVYSPSQLDAAGDVDPVAEADVYLAYGRDLQAEEILKEALKMNPTRLGIHGKLLEIYAKRRDARAFELVAIEAHKLTGGDGSEWERFCELGRELDSENVLYQPGGRPAGKTLLPAAPEPVHQAFGTSTLPASSHPEFAPSMPVDLDLGDLDLPSASVPVPASDAGRTVATAIPGKDDDTGMDWDVISTSSPEVDLTEIEPPIDISAPASSTANQPSVSVSAPQEKAGGLAVDDAGMIEFDLGSLSLDLDQSLPKTESASEVPQGEGADQDPMATKLSLAQEFHAIGDSDGARALVEEVVAGATGPLKAKAQRFLADLG